MRRSLNRMVLGGLALLAIFAVALQSAGADHKPGSKDHANGSKRCISWSVRRVVQTVAAGQTVKAPAVSFTTSCDLSDVELRLPAGLARVATIKSTMPASPASLKAGTTVALEIEFKAPATNAHSQGGALHVRSGKRNLGQPLHLKMSVPGTDDD